jgi:hypothetical protein
LKFILSAAELRAALIPPDAPSACCCAIGACPGWESLAEYRWEAGQMTPVATLRDPALQAPGDATLEEKHPQGTRYDSHDAPVAIKFFPYNRSDIWHCSRCKRYLLRYTEFGGYNVDPRVRAFDPAQLID